MRVAATLMTVAYGPADHAYKVAASAEGPASRGGRSRPIVRQALFHRVPIREKELKPLPRVCWHLAIRLVSFCDATTRAARAPVGTDPRGPRLARRRGAAEWEDALRLTSTISHHAMRRRTWRQLAEAGDRVEACSGGDTASASRLPFHSQTGRSNSPSGVVYYVGRYHIYGQRKYIDR